MTANKQSNKCPSCGAPRHIGHCEYCGDGKLSKDEIELRRKMVEGIDGMNRTLIRGMLRPFDRTELDKWLDLPDPLDKGDELNRLPMPRTIRETRYTKTKTTITYGPDLMAKFYAWLKKLWRKDGQ